MTTLRHMGYMALRDLRALWRQPWYVVATLVQPVIWLLLFGALFKRVVEIPGFAGGPYIVFLTPEALQKFTSSDKGWTAGVDASVTALSAGASATATTATATQQVVGYVLSKGGLMANLSFDGTKVSKLDL